MIGKRFRRTRSGEYQVRLRPDERDVLRHLPDQLRQMLGSDDPALRRLSPPAYVDDPESEAEYRRLVGEELISGRRQQLDRFQRTLDAERLDDDEAAAWLGCLNDLRLVLGTKLDVSEDGPSPAGDGDPNDPESAALALYSYLSWLVQDLVEALASQL